MPYHSCSAITDELQRWNVMIVILLNKHEFFTNDNNNHYYNDS